MRAVTTRSGTAAASAHVGGHGAGIGSSYTQVRRPIHPHHARYPAARQAASATALA